MAKIELYRICFLFTIAVLLSACTSWKKLATGEGPKDIREFIMEEGHKSGHLGLAVYNLTTDKEIYTYRDTDKFTPASNTKLLTLQLSIETLKDSLASIHYQINHDTLYFWGAGDPSILHPAFPDMQHAIRFLENWEGPLVLHIPDLAIDRFGPGWAWDDFDYSFQPEIGLFPIYGNSAHFTLAIEDEEVRVWSMPAYFESWVTLGTGSDRLIIREEAVNAFTVNPEMLTTDRPAKRVVPIVPDDYLLLQLLKDTLKKEINLAYDFKPSDTDYQTLSHTRLDSFYKRLIAHSDNFIAEQLLLAIAQKENGNYSTHELLEAISEEYRDWMGNSGNWADGSGLSRYNALSPFLMINLLMELHSTVEWERLKSWFPQPGISGSLKQKQYSPRPYVYAKSGSMKGVYNLTGYLQTRSGDLLAFSVMANQLNVTQGDWLTSLDKMLNNLYEHY